TYGDLLTTGLRGAYTALYASPQQAAGRDPDPRDDVHALGVVWHQLLSGDLLKGRPGGDAWKRRLAGQGMPQRMVDLLVSCCETDPEDRPADATVLAEQIAEMLKPQPPPPPPPPIRETGPSNKEQVYRLWEQNPEGDPQAWHQHVGGRVKLATIK